MKGSRSAMQDPINNTKSSRGREKVMFIVTADQSWVFFRGSMLHYREEGLEPILVSSPGPLLDGISKEECVSKLAIPIERDPSPLNDLRSLVRLLRALKSIEPAAVVAATPKASLLGLLAARIARVRIRIYHHYGLRLETETGIRRLVLRLFEEFTAANATSVVYVSRSLKKVAEHNVRTLRARSGDVLGSGSSHGVDLERFVVTDRTPSQIYRIGFVGRLNVDKGLSDLIDAFGGVLNVIPDARLVIAGGGDGDDLQLPGQIRANVDVLGHVGDSREAYSLMDILVLPTYREGLPNVCLEAQALGIPVVTTNATGANDAVRHRETGIIVPAGAPDEIRKAILELADPALRVQMGVKGRTFVEDEFSRPAVVAAMGKYINEQLGSR